MEHENGHAFIPFAKAVKSPEDVDVVYILNDTLTEKTEVDLLLITNDNLIDIQIIRLPKGSN